MFGQPTTRYTISKVENCVKFTTGCSYMFSADAHLKGVYTQRTDWKVLADETLEIS
jgi:hypothetical protein